MVLTVEVDDPGEDQDHDRTREEREVERREDGRILSA
jgi:hypothetical protein